MQIPQTVKAHRDSYRITVGFSMPAALFQIFIEESFQLLERDDVHLIVKIGVVGTGDDEQLLVVAGELAVSRLTEIAGVRFFSVYQQHGGANLAAVLQDWHIQEGKRRCHVPAVVGVQTAGMAASRRWCAACSVLFAFQSVPAQNPQHQNIR